MHQKIGLLPPHSHNEPLTTTADQEGCPETITKSLPPPIDGDDAKGASDTVIEAGKGRHALYLVCLFPAKKERCLDHGDAVSPDAWKNKNSTVSATIYQHPSAVYRLSLP